jgi:hypothetical protein
MEHLEDYLDDDYLSLIAQFLSKWLYGISFCNSAT